MTPTATSVNEARLWVLAPGLLLPGDSNRYPARQCLRTIDDDRIKLAPATETILGVVPGCHPSFGTPR
jgi:hypothetical protein